jgi:DNA replication protein DnaC
MSKIDETLRKIAGDMPSGNRPEDEPETEKALHDLPGDPNCPHCKGLGYLRNDLPVGHPEFGKLQICSCRKRAVSEQIRQRLYSLSNLQELRHLNFENFQPRGRIGLGPAQADSLEQAFNHSRQFAQKLEGWLLLQGRFGCGKTHLAAAIANFAVSMGVPTLFITVPDMLDTLRFSYSAAEITFEDRFEEIRQAPLLVMDDFGTQNATPWAQEKLFQILNYRYINQLPLVVTTNLALDEIEGRISSRLQDPSLVTRINILAGDYRNPGDATGHSRLSSLDLLHNRTFLNFDLRQEEGLKKDEITSLEKAFRAARAFAERPSGWLVLTGPYGCGKTHLAAAVANYQSDMGHSPLFVVVPDLLDHLRATFNPNSTVSLDRRFEEVRTSQLLILDDLGSQSMTPWVREKLYQLFNYRYTAELPTVITTSDHRDEMDPRLRSRIEDNRISAIYSIIAPAYRGLPQQPARKASSRRRINP